MLWNDLWLQFWIIKLVDCVWLCVTLNAKLDTNLSRAILCRLFYANNYSVVAVAVKRAIKRGIEIEREGEKFVTQNIAI